MNPNHGNERTLDPIRIWNVLRAHLGEAWTFTEIGEVVGVCGLDATKLSHLQQTKASGATKGQLISAVDVLFREKSEDEQLSFVILISERLIAALKDRGPSQDGPILSELRADLRPFGYTVIIDENAIVPIEMFDNSDLAELPTEARHDLVQAAKRFREGYLSEALNLACGVIDSVASAIIDNEDDSRPSGKRSFQEKVNRAYEIRDVYEKLKSELEKIGWEAESVKKLVNNLKGAVNQASYVMQSLRSNMGSAHGTKPVVRALVFDSIKIAQVIVRALAE